MDIKRTAKDTAQVLISYLTYKAVRVVIDQLRETDPPCAFWLNGFSSRDKLQNGEAYLEALLAERPALAMRIMTVRQHLAENVTEFLPEMVNTGIQQANTDHRRHHLERITQLSSADFAESDNPEDAETPTE